MPARQSRDDLRPDQVAVALDDRVRLAVLVRFVRKQRGVNAAEDDPRAALAREPADFVAAQRIAGVNADADDVAGRDHRRIERLERFVDDDGIAPLGSGRRRQDVQPARRDDATPNETWLGLIRWTREPTGTSWKCPRRL